MHKPKKVFKRIPILVAIFFLLFSTQSFLVARVGRASEQPSSIEQTKVISTFEQAWEQAQAAESYRFTADIEQTLIPRAVSSMIGQTDQRVDVRIEGNAQANDHYRLNINLEGNGFHGSDITFFQVGKNSFLETGNELIQLDAPLTGNGAPTHDYLSYLQAATNVQELSPELAGGETFSRFAFDIDSDKFNQKLRQQLDSAHTNGAYSVPFSMAAGRGELWIDNQGLPRRQILDLDMPGLTAEFDSRSRITTNFHDFGEVAPVPFPAQAGDGSWTLQMSHAGIPAATVTQVINRLASSIIVPLLLSSLTIIILILVARQYHIRPRLVYGGMAVILIGLQVTIPYLQVAAQTHAYTRQESKQEKINEALGIDIDKEVASDPQRETATSIAARTAASDASCGDAVSGTDSDTDGISDLAESCLGTDPFNPDSDGDLITDMLEITSFDFAGQSWSSNPVQPDSNGDGLDDFSEWPAPIGPAPSWDPDGDNVPNIWDADNDGDGVPDAIDLNPFSVTNYRNTFDISTQMDGFTGTQYIELHIQPQNKEHLRYSTTPFDWPYDDEGQIQDRDGSTADISLLPMLQLTTFQTPDNALAQQYGVSAFRNQETPRAAAKMLIPLAPISDGGQIVAFSGKAAYDAAQYSQIDWEEMQLVWIVQAAMEFDEYDLNLPIHVYAEEEAFRLTGLNVTKSGPFEMAIVGSPQTPEDDRYLFNLLFGTSATFLNNQSPDLAEITQRLNQPNTDPILTWGIPPAAVRVDLPNTPYLHQDEAFSDMDRRLQTYLGTNNYPLDTSPSLVIATQTTSGIFGLDMFDDLPTNGQITFNLANIPLTVQRGLRQQSYAFENNRWHTLDLDTTLELVAGRYQDLSGDLAGLQGTYPDLTTLELQQSLSLFYMTWYVGQLRIIGAEGQQLAPNSVPDQDVYNRYASTFDSLPSYLIDVSELAQPGAGLRFSTDPAPTWAYQRQYKLISNEVGISYNMVAETLATEDPFFLEGDLTLGAIRAIKTIKSLATIQQTIVWARSAETAWGAGNRLATMSIRSNVDGGSRTMGAVGAAIAVGLIWLQFATTTDFSNPSAVASAVINAVVASVITVALFAISLNPIGAVIVGILSVVELIVFVITGDSVMEEIIQGITDFIYASKPLTELGDVEYSGFATHLLEKNAGFSVGNRYILEQTFAGSIEATDDGSYDDLVSSNAYGAFAGNAPSDVTVQSKRTPSLCYIENNARHCRNDFSIEYQFNAPGRNFNLQAAPELIARVYNEECIFLEGCWRSSESIHQPEDSLDDPPISIYLDVLPNNLADFWNWDAAVGSSPHSFNKDLDGDGLTADQELVLRTDPLNWDSDGDQLSDRFEANNQAQLGTNPLDSDSDDDGLNDGEEYRLGTKINVSDSDSDGLSDLEEVNGWAITLPEFPDSVQVYSDPNTADTDADGLIDSSEKASGTSPYAINEAPRLTLTGSPFATSPRGERAMYVKPGETVQITATLVNVGPYPITSTLEVCLPAYLTNIQGGQMTGDRSPASTTPQSCPNGRAWDFSGDSTLQLWESVSTQLSATVNPNQPSINGAITAFIPYTIEGGAAPVNGRIAIVVDDDDPQINLLSPVDGALIGGGVSTYIIGGTAADHSSWVEEITINLPGSGVQTVGTDNPWAVSWTLPADGQYTLQAQARDYLGHTSSSSSVQVTVDNTPPVIGLNLQEGQFITGQGADSLEIELSGNATDNLSGVNRIQVSIDGRPWREVWADASAPQSATWQSVWELPNSATAQGEHTVAVRAYDAAMNLSTSLERTIIVDVVPPTNELTDRSYLNGIPQYREGEAFTLNGVANDAGNLPDSSRPVDLVGSLDSLQDATIWLGLDNIRENDNGVHVTWLGDFNGDRMADLAVGLPAAADGVGQIYIINGRAGGWPLPTETELLSSSTTSFIGLPGVGVGQHIAPAGDVNGDGFADFLIGDPINNVVFLIYGRSYQLGVNTVLDQDSDSPIWSVLLPPTGQTIGSTISAAGDVNGDGLDDILIGSDTATYLLVGQGGVWPTRMIIDQIAAAEINASGQPTPLGDTDGDQYDEFGLSNSNSVYQFGGSTSFIPYEQTPLELTAATDVYTSSNNTPQVAALGDVNGDTYADFIYADGGSPVVVWGNNGGTQALSGFAPPASGFIAAPGDVDADGRADILIGNSNNDAYLLLGSDLNTVSATFSDIDTAASTLYPAGADLNSDGSSDLLLIPQLNPALALYRSAFGSVPVVDQSVLPRTYSAGSSSSTPQSSSPQALEGPPVALRSAQLLLGNLTRYVDDDYCSTCLNNGLAWGTTAFSTIQAAVDAATAGDSIGLHEGVYAPFTVSKNNLEISGTNADAVFIQGNGSGDGIRIENAVGVQLEKMTIRQVDNGIHLLNAGAGGYATPANKTILRNLLIIGFTQHAVQMDRLSTAELSQSTAVGGDNHLNVYGPIDPAFDPEWGQISTDGRFATGPSGHLVADNQDLLIATGGGSRQIERYTPATSSWGTPLTAPKKLAGNSALAVAPNSNLWLALGDEFLGGANNTVTTIEYVNDNQIYAGGSFTEIGGQSISYIAQWNGTQWLPLSPGTPNAPTGAIRDISYGSGYVYVAGSFGVRRWSGSAWELIGTMNAYAVLADGASVYAGGRFTSLTRANGTSFPAEGVARWSAGTWYYVGESQSGACNGVAITGNVSYRVTSLAADNTHVYVGGFFNDVNQWSGTNCSSRYDHSLARANKSTNQWEPMAWDGGLIGGVGMGGRTATVNSLAVTADGRLVVGGNFTQVENYIASGDPNNTVSSAGLYIYQTSPFGPGSAWDINNEVKDVTTFGNDIYIAGDFTQGASGSPGTNSLVNANYVARISPNTFTPLGTGLNAAGQAIAASSSKAFIGGGFTQAGGSPATRFTAWDGTSFSGQGYYEYDGAAWQTRAPLPVPMASGSSLVANAQGNLLAIPGGSTDFYQYTVSSNSWAAGPSFPTVMGVGANLISISNTTYALNGTQFYSHTAPAAVWTTLAPLPFPMGAGSSLTGDGGDHIYVAPGGNGSQFLQYTISTNSWATVGDGSSLTTDDNDIPTAVQAGAGLVHIGNSLYAVPGGSNSELLEYTPLESAPVKLTLDRTAFVVPEQTTAASWSNLNPASLPTDFNINGGNNAWVSGDLTAWSPVTTTAVLTNSQVLNFTQAQFLDSVRKIYRLDEGSLLSSGYHTYRSPAAVAPSGAEFTSLQAAIDSGANQINVAPGIYYESIHLASGVQVNGTGADLTILAADGSGQPLVRAEGNNLTSLNRFTLQGDGFVDGVVAQDGAQNIKISRNVARGLVNAIALDGSNTETEIVNNTLVGNENGIMAVNCAPIDMRNNALSDHSGVGLSYEGCAPTTLHTYNNYWNNGSDMSPLAPQSGELFLLPLFENPAGKNYHLTGVSPLVDRGDPSDPTLPGTGNRIDIGYAEYGRASFYVDDDYCQRCANDSLIWQTTAFDHIQDALDAAETYLQTFVAADESAQITVGVAPGSYNESVIIPSYVRLVGSGPEETTIWHAGTAVTFMGSVQAELSGFNVENSTIGVELSGASNEILLTRNILQNNTTAVQVQQRATGKVTFNTFVSNGESVTSDGLGSWALVENNIFSQNQVGLTTKNDSHLFNDYNLLFNSAVSHYDDQSSSGLKQQLNEIIDTDPLFTTGDFQLRPTSPAVDAGSPLAAIPAGGGSRADIGYKELSATPVPLFLGKENVSTAVGNSGVNGVEIGIVPVGSLESPITTTLPSTWTPLSLSGGGQTVATWSFTPGTLPAGSYRFYSRATDVVGNQEIDPRAWYEGSFVIDGVAPTVTIVSPALTTGQSPLLLQATVTDDGPQDDLDLFFNIDGINISVVRTSPESMGQNSASSSSFHTWVNLADGVHTIRAIARDGAGNEQTDSLTLTIAGQSAADTTPPTLAIQSPSAGGWVTRTVTFSGTAADAESGLATVEVSLDGGISWREALLSGSNWQLSWDGPDNQEFVSYPAWVRATDFSGNETTLPRIITIDNIAPTSLTPVTFSITETGHVDEPTPLTINWNPPQDGGGQADVLLLVDQLPTTIPTAPADQVNGLSATRNLSGEGDWYVHLAARDAAGNQFTRHFGPWHVGSFADVSQSCQLREQSIDLDGWLDWENDEWRLDNEFIDDAEDGRERQSLFTTWDGTALYIGWQGAWWSLDGDLWIYLDWQAGGTNQPIGTAPGGSLPFGADAAIQISDPAQGWIREYDGNAWGSRQPVSFSNAETGGTEIRIPWDIDQITGLNMIAFAENDQNEVWTVFPTDNSLDQVPQSVYNWSDLCQVLAPNNNQNRGLSVDMAVTTPQSTSANWGATQVLTYSINLINKETYDVLGLQLDLMGTTGLAFQSVDGATCNNCAVADKWLLDVPVIPANGQRDIVVTAQLSSILKGLTAVTQTTQLLVAAVTLDVAELTHQVDGEPPTVTIYTLPGQAIRSGDQTIHGAAEDGNGSGVKAVYYRPQGVTTWSVAEGSTAWEAPLTVPNNLVTYVIEVQAEDRLGNLSAVQSVTLNVDATPPDLTATLPLTLSGDYAAISGTAYDPAPNGAAVVLVEVQIDDATAGWQPAVVYEQRSTGQNPGQQVWNYTWDLPLEDAQPHTLRFRAIDAVGNISDPTGWQPTIIDNVAPVITVTAAVGTAGPGGDVPVLRGIVSDGSGVSEIIIHAYGPSGQSYRESVTFDGTNWEYVPSLTASGRYQLRVEAVDNVGNSVVTNPFQLDLGLSHQYLPVIMNHYRPPAPDLVVENVVIENNRFEITIKNRGEGIIAAGRSFWVDVYVDPKTAPTGINQTWDMLGTQGLVWGIQSVASPLAQGDSITLSLGDDYFISSYSYLEESLLAGTPIYVQVDSASVNSSYGAIYEEHEYSGGAYNNIYQLVLPENVLFSDGFLRGLDTGSTGADRR